jgi:CSLREA domain-containing protein
MAFKSLFSLFSSDLAIDLGTANTLVYAKGRGIVVSEPSIVAINKVTNLVEAVGRDAKEMLGRTPGNIVAIRPMKDGVIANFEVTEKMLQHFIRKAHNGKSWVRPRVVIGIPSEITQVERRAVEDSAYRAKASEVYLVEEAMAAAIGAGLPITEPHGNMIVDIGAAEENITIQPPTLPTGIIQQNYSQTLTANRLSSFAKQPSGFISQISDATEKFDLDSPQLLPLVFSIAAGSLPNGLTLSPGGRISGTPAASGIFNFAIRVTDSDGIAAVRSYTLQITQTFTVNSLDDTVDEQGCNQTHCSLREAINASNSDAALNIIYIGVNGTIQLGRTLPTVTTRSLFKRTARRKR